MAIFGLSEGFCGFPASVLGSARLHLIFYFLEGQVLWMEPHFTWPQVHVQKAHLIANLMHLGGNEKSAQSFLA